MCYAWEAILADTSAAATSIVDGAFTMVLEFVVIINYSGFVCNVGKVLIEGHGNGSGASGDGQGSGNCRIRELNGLNECAHFDVFREGIIKFVNVPFVSVQMGSAGRARIHSQMVRQEMGDMIDEGKR